MIFELGYGHSVQQLSIPDAMSPALLEENKIDSMALRGVAEVERALEEPIQSPLLETIVKPGQKIAIVTSDISRPMPTRKVLPSVLKRIYKAGVKASDITIVFALGSHRKQTEGEQRSLVGDEVFNTIRCVDSSACQFIHLGNTAMGTPVDIAEPVAEADLRICLGNIDYHYFAGYSGGAKAIMPGSSTMEAIQHNHSRMVEEKARAGLLEGNPVRQDLEEGAAICGIDFIVNVVLDEHKEIVCAVAGHAVAAHREGCAFVDKMYLKPISKRADIVVASIGGAPKDLNLYQTQKALDNAAHAVKKGGTIILMGACGEGLGNPVFQQWITSAPTPESLIERIQSDFHLGGHKAAAIAMVLRNAQVYLVSEMEPEFVKTLFLKPASTVQQAFDAAVANHGDSASVIVMPNAGSTLPYVTDEATD